MMQNLQLFYNILRITLTFWLFSRFETYLNIKLFSKLLSYFQSFAWRQIWTSGFSLKHQAVGEREVLQRTWTAAVLPLYSTTIMGKMQSCKETNRNLFKTNYRKWCHEKIWKQLYLHETRSMWWLEVWKYVNNVQHE